MTFTPQKISVAPNWVLVQIQGQTLEKVRGLFIDVSFNPGEHSNIYGVVKSAPQKLLYFNKEVEAIKNEFGGSQNCPLHRLVELQELTARSTLYDVDAELQEGDFIFFRYNVYGEAQQDGRIFTRDKDMFIVIPYDSVYLAIRDDEIIPVNGIVLVEPIKEQHDTSLVMLEKEDQTMGVIAHLGSEVRSYLGFDESDDDFYQVGDKIIFRRHRNVPVEWSIHQRLDKKYFKMHRKDILCKVS